MTQTPTDPVPNPVSQQDVSALIGCLAVLHGEQWAGSVDDYLWRRIAQRFTRVGLLGDTWEDHDVRQALSDLNQRLRYALGEYDEPPAPERVP